MQEITSSPVVRTRGVEFPSLADSVKSPPMSKMAMNEVTTFRWSLLEDVVAYREAGFEAIGIWRPKLSEFGEERGIELVHDSNLRVSSLSWIGGFTGANGLSFDDAIDDGRDALQTAARLGAQSLVVVSGGRAGHTVNHSRRLVVDAMKRLSEDAEEHNILLALQPMLPMFSRGWTFLNSIDETLDIISASGCSNLRIAFDVYHLWQEHRLLERIEEISQHVSVVQLNDWSGRPRSESDRCQIGDGIIPLAQIVRAFVEADYDGFFEVGIWSEELWKSNYDELIRNCRSRLSDVCQF